MSVRKRKWTTRAGEAKEAWVVDYVANGSRHIETFERKKDADVSVSTNGKNSDAKPKSPSTSTRAFTRRRAKA